MPSPPITKPAIYNNAVSGLITTPVPGLITTMRRRMDRMLYGQTPDQIKAIRRDLGLSQDGFAARFGLSPRTLQQWESGRRRPDRASVLLLKVIAHAPDVVNAALTAHPDAATLMRTARQDRPRSEPDPLSDPLSGPDLDSNTPPQDRPWTLRW